MADLFADIPVQPRAGLFDDVPDVQGDASKWGALQEGINSAAGGIGPKLDEWMGNNAPTWMMGGVKPTTAAQEQANADAYKQQNPKTAIAADVIGGSLPYMGAGAALGPLGLGARALGMAATGAATQWRRGCSPRARPHYSGSNRRCWRRGGRVWGQPLYPAAGGKGLANAILNRGVNIPLSAQGLRDIANPQYDALKANGRKMPLSEGSQFGQDTSSTPLNAKWAGDTKTAKEFGKFLNPPSGKPLASQPGGLSKPARTLSMRSSANSQTLARLQRREWVNKLLISWSRLKQLLIRLGLISNPKPKPPEEIGQPPKVQILSPEQPG